MSAHEAVCGPCLQWRGLIGRTETGEGFAEELP